MDALFFIGEFLIGPFSALSLQAYLMGTLVRVKRNIMDPSPTDPPTDANERPWSAQDPSRQKEQALV